MAPSMSIAPLADACTNISATTSKLSHTRKASPEYGLTSNGKRPGDPVIDLVSSDEDESYEVKRAPLLSKPRDDTLDSFFHPQQTLGPSPSSASGPHSKAPSSERPQSQHPAAPALVPSASTSHPTQTIFSPFTTKRPRGRPRKDALPYQAPVKIPKPRGRPRKYMDDNTQTSRAAVRADEPPTYRTMPVVVPPPRPIPFHFDLRDPHRQRIQLDTEPPIYLYNNVDDSRLPPTFEFIHQYIFREGTRRTPEEFVVGCECGPHNGRDIGCEYLQRCDCMEDATREVRNYDGEVTFERLGFPYSAADSSYGCLRDIYLERHRSVVYECNDKCNCGPNCKNKVISRGRQVPLEIFRTPNRGWGVRCLKDLQKGQFIDVYLGEVLTNEEADRRSDQAGKDSYLFDLDKFEDDVPNPDDLWVVDGQFFGNATRFVNHSCDPNLAQISVSLNRGDPQVYELAFFAKRAISAGEELCFDYLDKDAEDGSNEDEESKDDNDETKGKRVECLCGADNCRKWLWL